MPPPSADQASSALKGLSLLRVFKVWWTECVLFLVTYALVLLANGLAGWATLGVAYSRFAGGWLASLLEHWLFWLSPVAKVVPNAVRAELAWALMFPLAWASYLWTARAVGGRTLSGYDRRTWAQRYSLGDLLILRWLTFGAFVAERPTELRPRVLWALPACWFAVKACVDFAAALQFVTPK